MGFMQRLSCEQQKTRARMSWERSVCARRARVRRWDSNRVRNRRICHWWTGRNECGEIWEGTAPITSLDSISNRKGQVAWSATHNVVRDSLWSGLISVNIFCIRTIFSWATPWRSWTWALSPHQWLISFRRILRGWIRRLKFEFFQRQDSHIRPKIRVGLMVRNHSREAITDIRAWTRML